MYEFDQVKKARFSQRSIREFRNNKIGSLDTLNGNNSQTIKGSALSNNKIPKARMAPKKKFSRMNFSSAEVVPLYEGITTDEVGKWINSRHQKRLTPPNQNPNRNPKKAAGSDIAKKHQIGCLKTVTEHDIGNISIFNNEAANSAEYLPQTDPSAREANQVQNLELSKLPPPHTKKVVYARNVNPPVVKATAEGVGDSRAMLHASKANYLNATANEFLVKDPGAIDLAIAQKGVKRDMYERMVGNINKSRGNVNPDIMRRIRQSVRDRQIREARAQQMHGRMDRFRRAAGANIGLQV